MATRNDVSEAISAGRADNQGKDFARTVLVEFSGKSNAGLRKAIRDAADKAGTEIARSLNPDGPSPAAAVRALARKVALTAQGKASLERCAAVLESR